MLGPENLQRLLRNHDFVLFGLEVLGQRVDDIQTINVDKILDSNENERLGLVQAKVQYFAFLRVLGLQILF